MASLTGIWHTATLLLASRITTSPAFLLSFELSKISTRLFSPPVALLNLPSILDDIWDGVLKAVPKKKTSHMKRRHRQLAGKALKDVTSLKPCPACGQPRRAHHLCQTCVDEIRNEWIEARKDAKRQALAKEQDH